MDISFLSEYMIPVIVGICLCVGWIVKQWIKDVDNRYIPTICALLGVALACWLFWFVAGLASGRASTGLHQAFKQILEGFGNGK